MSSSLEPSRSGVRRSVSSIAKRHVRSRPSAVMRMRSQEAQNGSRDRVDEAELAAPSANREAPGGRRGRRVQRHERVDGLDHRPQLLAGDDVGLVPRLVGVERHELDEADDERAAARELREGQHLLLGDAAHGDAVDLDRPQLRVALGLGQAVHARGRACRAG